MKFSKISDETFLTTKRLFTVVRNTILISEQILFRQQTTNGFLYFIDKNFYELVERHHCRISRQKRICRNDASPVSERKEADNLSASSKLTIIDI